MMKVIYSKKEVDAVLPYIMQLHHCKSEDSARQAIVELITQDVEDDTYWRQGLSCLFVTYHNSLAELSISVLVLNDQKLLSASK